MLQSLHAKDQRILPFDQTVYFIHVVYFLLIYAEIFHYKSQKYTLKQKCTLNMLIKFNFQFLNVTNRDNSHILFTP